ncbi:MAG TPA: hypothetical protein VM689_20050 [Aliidongia sp.]|nr:hypothetical protein [Aliidongia sp.]
MLELPIYTRRLSDKILWAFDQAIEQKSLEVAGLLMQALELALTREGGAGRTDRRQDLDHVMAAYDKLKEATQPTA